MNEADRQEAKRVFFRSNEGATMSLAEKTTLWGTPLMLAWLSSPFILISVLDILFLVAKARGLVVKGSGSDRDALIGTLIMWISPLLATTLLYFSFAIFSRMIRRKRKTGSLLPTGEELNAVRKRSSSRTRILVPALFYYFAIGFTFSAITFHDFRVSACVFLVIMWLIAISVTVLASRPTEPRCLVAVVGVLFCLAAIYSTYHALADQRDRGHWSIFSAFMWAAATGTAVDVFRLFAQKRPTPTLPGGPQTPPETESR
jgi:hypothetical protein